MQSKNSVTSSEVVQSPSDTMAEYHLRKLFEIVDYDPWGAVWEKLTNTQKKGLCLVAGISVENGEYHENWVNFTRADCERLQGAITKFCSVAEKVKRAIGAGNAVRGEVSS